MNELFIDITPSNKHVPLAHYNGVSVLQSELGWGSQEIVIPVQINLLTPV